MDKNVAAFRKRFQKLTKNKKQEYLKTLSDDEMRWMLSYPEIFLFDKQIIPDGNWRYYILRCGRSFGKTFAGSAWIASKVYQGAGTLALCGATHKDIIGVMVKAILAWFPQGEATYVGGDKAYIKFKSFPAIIYCYSSDGNLRGPNIEYFWCDEIVKWCDGIPDKVKEAFNVADFAVRIGSNPQILVTSTPKPFPLFFEWQEKCQQHPELYRMQTGTMFDNPTLPKSFIDAMVSEYGKTRLGLQELYGDLLNDVQGSLWSQLTLKKTRISTEEFNQLIEDQRLYLERTIVTVDPAGTHNARSDETGIIVMALGNNNHVYCLKDASLRAPPKTWGQTIIDCVNEFQADCVIAENNMGGDMVEWTIHSLDPSIPVISRHTQKGKRLRAQPVSALHEKGEVHIVGNWPELENQLIYFTGLSASEKNDRTDAFVYGVNELRLSKNTTYVDFTNLPAYL